MSLKLIKSNDVYRELLEKPMDERDSIFKEKLLMPFQEKFDMQHVSFNDTDSLNVMTMLSYIHKMPKDLTKEDLSLINRFDDNFWMKIANAFDKSLNAFISKGIHPIKQNYYVTALLGDVKSPLMSINENYSGDGGIPGYIILSLVPNDYTINRIASAMAHEMNHNIRYQFINWGNGALKEMIVAEGLAETFAEKLFGTDKIGPWVTKNNLDTLNNLIKPKLKEHLEVDNMHEAMPYIYGDGITEIQGGNPVGLPYASGYTCGYYLIQHYLKQTNITVEEATLKTADEILETSENFWDDYSV